MVKVVISGAGPAGLLLAQNLIQQPNYDVHVFEKRPDLRTTAGININKDRVYPICIHPIGMNAMAEVPGLQPSLEQYGKWIDKSQRYNGESFKRSNRSPPAFFIARSSLATCMLEHLQLIDDNPAAASGSFTPYDDDVAHRDPTSSLSMHFDCGIDGVCLDKQIVTTDTGTTESFDHIVAADGARSAVRNQLVESNHIESTMKKTSHSYRSLAIPTDDSIVRRDSMHSWTSRGSHQVLLFPVDDAAARGIYQFPIGDDPFENMTSPHEVIDYFRTTVSTHFADALTPQAAERILSGPVGDYPAVHCDALTTIDAKAVLIGDAAHAMAPMLGLGCNSALQDVQVLCGKLVQHDHDWRKALQEYNDERLAQAHAVCELSEHAFPLASKMEKEMIARFILKKLLPGFLSKRMRPMPIEVMTDDTMSFTEMLERCRWWTDRVKASKA